MVNAAPEIEADPEVLTVAEVAKLLRFNVKYMYELLSQGKIPGARRVGQSWRIHRATVLAWLSSDQQAGSRPRSK